LKEIRMPRPKSKSTEPKPKQPKYAQPVVADGEEKAGKFSGPWFAITADAICSKTYTGKVDLGTYTDIERRKGKLQSRLDSLTAQGYKNVDVREIPAE
jgi:hypothetical protein